MAFLQRVFNVDCVRNIKGADLEANGFDLWMQLMAEHSRGPFFHLVRDRGAVDALVVHYLEQWPALGLCDATDSSGYTALHHCFKNKRRERAVALLKRGAQFNFPTGPQAVSNLAPSSKPPCNIVRLVHLLPFSEQLFPCSYSQHMNGSLSFESHR